MSKAKRGKKKKPRKPKLKGQRKEKVETFILAVISSVLADLITYLVHKLLE
jgi:hypothetical protein